MVIFIWYSTIYFFCHFQGICPEFIWPKNCMVLVQQPQLHVLDPGDLPLNMMDLPAVYINKSSQYYDIYIIIDVNTYTESEAHTIFRSTPLCYVYHQGAARLLVLTPADDFLTHQTMSVWCPLFFQRPQGKHQRWLENHQYII